MGCCGGEREKYGNLNAEQKWEYIVCIERRENEQNRMCI
jgi:hypothetical protein